MKNLIIAIDFDGTCVKHEFPEIGGDIGAAPVLKRWTEEGHKLILYTMRSNDPNKRQFLTEAIQWFNDNKIPLWGINQNPDQSWSSSPKPYAHLYIDDHALGCPTKTDESGHMYVDWDIINNIL